MKKELMIKSGVTTMEFIDGDSFNMTLNFRYLYELRNKNKEQYDKYFSILENGTQDLFDSTSVLYTAYSCSCLMEGKEIMPYDEFLEKLQPNPNLISRTAAELIRPKKK